VLGAAGPTGGIALAFTAGPKAVVAPDAACARAAPASGAPAGAVVGAAAAAVAVLAGAITLARRRAR
jgi:hypothetical protein